MTYRTATAGLAVTLLLAACGSTSTTDADGDEPAQPSEDGMVSCGGSQYRPDNLALVRERECASGQSAEGRIELVDLTLTAEQIQLHVGVQPLGGGQECPGNPPTPFTVDIGEPIGDREIVDTSVAPPRTVTTDTTE